MNLKITNSEKHFDKTPELNSSRGIHQDKEKLAKAAQQFESMLTSLMLKSMTQSSNGMFNEEGFGGDMFDTIFINEIAEKFSSGKGLGIAEMLYKKVTGEELPADKIISAPNSHKIEVKSDPHIKSVVPSKQSLNRLDDFQEIIEEASKKYSIDQNIIKAVILAESAANEKALSKANAKGLMQLIDSTAKDMGVNNVWNPKENIFGGTKYLSGLLRQYNGDLNLALAGYNAGPGNVQKFNGIPPFEETKNYIIRVNSYLNHFNGLPNAHSEPSIAVKRTEPNTF